MKIQGVVFDMDGLLFDTETLTFNIWREVLAKKGLILTLAFYKTTVGKRTVETATMYKEKFGEDFDYYTYRLPAMERFWDYTATKGVPKKQGLDKLLAFLKENKIKIALATSTTTKSATEILSRADVLEYFDVMICGDKIKEGKPHPEIFETAVKELGLKPENCLGLEDSYNGIISSYKAGLVTVMVPDLIEPDDNIKNMCYKVLHSLEEVLELIKFNL